MESARDRAERLLGCAIDVAPERKETVVKRLLLALLLLATVAPLTGCVVYGPGRPGWCYYHPNRC